MNVGSHLEEVDQHNTLGERQVKFFTLREVRHRYRSSREAVDGPSQKMFKTKLNGALSNLAKWKTSQPRARGLELDGL